MTDISVPIGDELEAIVNGDARAVAVKLWAGLTRVTPVGNPDLWVYNHPQRGYIDYIGYFGKPDYVGGRARSNWFMSVGSPNRTVTEETNPSSSKQSKNSAISQAKKIDFPTIIISNNLPYIQRLNDGWSTQAPKKFIETEINRAVKASNLNGG